MRVIEARILVGTEKTLQVFVDHKEANKPVDTSDCKRINEWFDEHPETLAWVSGSYNLEISSPGIEKPLRLVEDWKSALGKEVSFLLDRPVEGLRKGIGVVDSVDPGTLISLVMKQKKSKETHKIGFTLENLSKANLVYKPFNGVNECNQT
jgi:ribosome maturation factor RimP